MSIYISASIVNLAFASQLDCWRNNQQLYIEDYGYCLALLNYRQVCAFKIPVPDMQKL